MRRIQAICGQVAASSSISVAPTTTPIIFPTPSSSSSSTTVVGGPVGRVHANRVAIVTGGASGIGEATVLAFAAQGASVAIFDMNATAGNALATKLTIQGHDVKFYDVDVSDSSRCKAATELWAQANGGKIHALVNNAVYFGSKGIDVTKEDWDRSFGVNVQGYSNMVQACYPFFIKAGGRQCSVVNLASISGHIAQVNRWTYSATKGAVLVLTKCMALDLGKDGIRVNSVSPAWIWSPEVAKAAVDGGKEKWGPVWGKFHMLRRVGECDEVANVLTFLCSDQASFITATDVPIDGGYLSMAGEGLGENSNFAGSKY